MRALLEENQCLGTEYKPKLFLICDFLSTLLISKGKFSWVAGQTWITSLTFYMVTCTLLPKAHWLLQCLSQPCSALSLCCRQTSSSLETCWSLFVCFQVLVQHCKICSGAVVLAHTMWSSLLFPEPLSTWDKTHSAHVFTLLFDGAVKVHVAAAAGTSEILPEEC